MIPWEAWSLGCWCRKSSCCSGQLWHASLFSCERKEKTTPVGVNSVRSRILYCATQGSLIDWISDTCFQGCYPGLFSCAGNVQDFPVDKDLDCLWGRQGNKSQCLFAGWQSCLGIALLYHMMSILWGVSKPFILLAPLWFWHLEKCLKDALVSPSEACHGQCEST